MKMGRLRMAHGATNWKQSRMLDLTEGMRP